MHLPGLNEAIPPGFVIHGEVHLDDGYLPVAIRVGEGAVELTAAEHLGFVRAQTRASVALETPPTHIDLAVECVGVRVRGLIPWPEIMGDIPEGVAYTILEPDVEEIQDPRILALSILTAVKR